MDFKEKIKPFFWVEHDAGKVSLCLDVGSYKAEVFDTRAGEGFEGGGYDWESLALVFLNERLPELKECIDFDSEAGMFCAYSSNKTALEKFAIGFKDACENDALIQDLFSQAVVN